MLLQIIYYLLILNSISICWTRSYSNGDEVLSINNDHHSSTVLSRSRRAVAVRGKQWTNNVIPYEISNKFGRTAQLAIVNAMRILEQNVSDCIKFRPKTSIDKVYLRIQMIVEVECSSTVGHIYEPVMNLHRVCLYLPILLHELMHSLGFTHEHSRPDRDNFVRVFDIFVQPGSEKSFEKRSWFSVDTLDLPYDYESIMHYSSFRSSIYKGLPAMLPTKNSSAQIGRRNGLSPIDIKGIRRYYKCEHYISNATVPSVVPDNSFDIQTVLILLCFFCIIYLCGFVTALIYVFVWRHCRVSSELDDDC